MPLLRAITEAFGPNTWFNTIVALTHAAAAPPDGNQGPISYDTYTRTRTQLLQQNIRSLTNFDSRFCVLGFQQHLRLSNTLLLSCFVGLPYSFRQHLWHCPHLSEQLCMLNGLRWQTCKPVVCHTCWNSFNWCRAALMKCPMRQAGGRAGQHQGCCPGVEITLIAGQYAGQALLPNRLPSKQHLRYLCCC